MLWKFHEVALGVRAGARAINGRCEDDVLASSLPVSAKSSIATGKVCVSPPSLSVPTIQTAFTEWQNNIRKPPPPPKNLGQKWTIERLRQIFTKPDIKGSHKMAISRLYFHFENQKLASEKGTWLLHFSWKQKKKLKASVNNLYFKLTWWPSMTTKTRENSNVSTISLGENF